MDYYSIYLLVGVFVFVVGLVVRKELKEDDEIVSGGNIILFSLIAFIVGLGISIEKFWMLLLLIPYGVIAFFINGKKLKKTIGEFLIGTGAGAATIIVMVVLLVVWLIRKNK